MEFETSFRLLYENQYVKNRLCSEKATLDAIGQEERVLGIKNFSFFLIDSNLRIFCA